MKKVLGVLSLVILIIGLVGCGGAKEQSSTYTLSLEGTEIEMTYYYKNDKVTKQTTNSTVPYSSIGAADKEEAKSIIEPLAKQYENVTGVKHEVDYQEDKLVEKTEVDYSKASLKEVSELTGTMFDDTEEADFVSMKKSEEMLLSNGFTKK
ncbi:YehR family lipoprotein [Paenibacillus sp. 1001270B_150601_E10]|uniref:YehR family lipoprotein n=1 Tax=Paenibacillus sp. 1001270B_150601_E10 TaxID=2787079 RepID=UPI00189E273F|nr:YehR family protein [Paenibacillus sp. 1001270B_150601_E10]